MRGARWLLLAAIVAILGSVAVTYQRQRREVETQAPAKPAPLPEKVQGTMADWHWKKSTPGRTEVEIWAKQFRAEPDEFQLEGVRLHIFQKDGGQYHRFESASAVFNPSQDQIFSEGAVTITLGVPIKGEAKRQLVSIRTSGVTFEGKRGLASTDRVAEFVFENGTGKSTGAAYDVNSRELQMRGNVALNWKAPGRKAMHLEAGALIYREAVSHIFLFPWAKLQRDNGSLTGGDTLVHLNEGVIQTIETQKASGADRYPRREVEYAADRLTVNFNDSGEAEKIIGEGQARLVSTSETARTTMTSDRVDLDFETADGEQALKTAIARGHGVVETAPLPGKTADPPPQTRVLHSEVIEMQMRPGGREISTVATHTPGRIEFLAGRPGQRRREMKGDRLGITYGARNVIQSFRAVEAETRTDPPSGQPKAAPSQTWSKNLVAEFDAKGQMARMEQWDDFRYQEGARRATAAKATLDSAANRILLET
ncbi:MAG: LPS export ABC transporter periplasmic protein LptC, partial [Candidatus Solibacter usitatus]|nr:LPS export ABC transporter periplasmic protein LptC [Candidatus Solibacter usitatus]